MVEEEIFSASAEEDLIDRTWKKLEQNLRKEGFREGASKGQEEYYQKGFNLGFSEGFQLGEALGHYKGTSSVLNQFNSKQQRVLEDYEKDRACLLCQNENLLNGKVEDILAQQRDRNSAIISDFSRENEKS